MERTKTRGVVSRDREVTGGALVFAGTRVPVRALVDYIVDGDGLEDFLEGFPTVSREQAVAYLELTPEAMAEAADTEREASASQRPEPGEEPARAASERGERAAELVESWAAEEEDAEERGEPDPWPEIARRLDEGRTSSRKLYS